MTPFPLAGFLPVVTSAVLLGTLWSLGDLTVRALVLLIGWFLLAAYAQFFAASSPIALSGLIAQTALALFLVVRWRLAE